MTGRLLLLGVDVETDVGSFTPFYDGTRHGTPRLLALFGRKGITGTFFFVGQTARDNDDIVRLVRDAGHEIGCHSLYHETVGDQLMPIPGSRRCSPTRWSRGWLWRRSGSRRRAGCDPSRSAARGCLARPR